MKTAKKALPLFLALALFSCMAYSPKPHPYPPPPPWKAHVSPLLLYPSLVHLHKTQREKAVHLYNLTRHTLHVEVKSLCKRLKLDSPRSLTLPPMGSVPLVFHYAKKPRKRLCNMKIKGQGRMAHRVEILKVAWKVGKSPQEKDKRVITLPSLLRSDDPWLWLVNPHKHQAKVDLSPPWGLRIHPDKVKIPPYRVKRVKLVWQPYGSSGSLYLKVKTRDRKYHLKVDVLR